MTTIDRDDDMFRRKSKVNVRRKSPVKSIRDFEKDLLRNNKGGGKVTNCNIDRDEFTITIDIDDAKFEMTYGQAALILMALKGIYNK